MRTLTHPAPPILPWDWMPDPNSPRGQEEIRRLVSYAMSMRWIIPPKATPAPRGKHAKH